ncbi:hypothetical protein BASA83_012072 [Batrachochytrium salamandrivorans]|nr:hypothetical protein BASA83_012072 [Batrachochytrium salamandrivorans]
MASISSTISDILSHPPGSRWIQRKLTQCKIGQYQPRSMISKSSSDLPISIGGLFRTYAKTTQPLTALLKKDIKFDWNQATEDSFKALKKAFKDNVILTHADESQEFLVEVDASDFAVAGVLSQYNNQRDLQPVAFFSRQMVPAERNYEIYDKELLAIAVCLKEWRHFLQNSIKPFHYSLRSQEFRIFHDNQATTRRQARWAELLIGIRLPTVLSSWLT